MCIQYFKSRLSSGCMLISALYCYSTLLKNIFTSTVAKLIGTSRTTISSFEFLHKPNWGELNNRVRTHRVATATFWRTFHHDGISPVLWGWGDARPSPFTISTITYKVVGYAPAERAYTIPLSLLYLYMYSVSLINKNVYRRWSSIWADQ
jgi:hypothetical protein